MEQYEIIKTALGWMPILIILILFIFVRNVKWQYRYPIVVIIGWVIVFLSTLIILRYSFDYAPNEEIKEVVATQDGAPIAFSYLFGWVYALILMLIMDGLHKLYLFLFRRYKKRETYEN